MSNDVEIRFRVVDEKSTPTAASSPSPNAPTAPPSAILRPAEYAQKERDAARRLDQTVDLDRRFAMFEQRLQYRMMRLGARFAASAAVEEIGGVLGVENAFVTRLGSAAIEGGMMGGAVGASVRTILALVHEVINQVKSNSDEVKRLRELGIRRDEEAAAKFVDVRIDISSRLRQIEEDNRKAVEEFNERVRDYMANAVRYITVPYTGRG